MASSFREKHCRPPLLLSTCTITCTITCTCTARSFQSGWVDLHVHVHVKATACTGRSTWCNKYYWYQLSCMHVHITVIYVTGARPTVVYVATVMLHSGIATTVPALVTCPCWTRLRYTVYCACARTSKTKRGQ